MDHFQDRMNQIADQVDQTQDQMNHIQDQANQTEDEVYNDEMPQHRDRAGSV